MSYRIFWVISKRSMDLPTACLNLYVSLPSFLRTLLERDYFLGLSWEVRVEGQVSIYFVKLLVLQVIPERWLYWQRCDSSFTR